MIRLGTILDDSDCHNDLLDESGEGVQGCLDVWTGGRSITEMFQSLTSAWLVLNNRLIFGCGMYWWVLDAMTSAGCVLG